MSRQGGMPTDRDKFWRMQGGPRDRFMRRSSIEAADLLNFMDPARQAANRDVVSDFIDSDLEWTEQGDWDSAPTEPRHRWNLSEDWDKRPLHQTEEDQPVIWNEAFDEGWQIMNRSEDSFDTAWDLLKTRRA